ncbi:MAG: heme ABC exporter ATP-binding protein CcmA [Dichotomicrobium sp.]
MKLVVDNLSCARGSRVVLEGVTFAAVAGESVLLSGPNGSGKTTLLRTLAGFITPQSGRAWLEGGPKGMALDECCHYVGHLNGIKAGFTVDENLGFLAAYLGGGMEAIEAAARAFDLELLRHVPAGFLSAGQKRRLGLARLVLAHRPVWLLDEPTVSLDAASSDLLAEAVQAHAAAGGITVAASHLSLGVSFSRTLRLASGHAQVNEAAA